MAKAKGGSNRRAPAAPAADDEGTVVESSTLDQLDEGDSMWQDNEAIDQLMSDAEGDGGWTYWVYRMPTGLQLSRQNFSWGYLFHQPLKDLHLGKLLEMLKDEHGGGEYRLQIRNPKGRVVFSKKYAIAGAVKAAAASGAAAEGAGGELLTRLMEMNQRANDQSRSDFQTMMMAMQQQSSAAADRTMQMMLALLSNNRPADPMQMVGGVAQVINALRPADAGGLGNLAQMVTVFKDMRDIIGEGDGGGGREPDSPWSMVKDVAGAVVPLIADRLAAAPAPPPAPLPTLPSRPAAVPLPVPHVQIPSKPSQAAPPAAVEGGASAPPVSPAAPATPATPAKPEPTAMNPLNLLRPLILAAAAKNRDPETYADLLLDQIPEMFHEQLLAAMQGEGWRAELHKIEPRLLAQFPAWTETLRAALVALLTGDAGEGEAGDDGEDGAHAPPDIETIPPASNG